MLKINRDFSFAFIAGKNKKLKAKAEKIAKERTKNGIVLGHTDNMAELINAASIVVGKPGGLITTECIEMNTPICAVQPIPGQELKNIDFLTSNGFGIYPKTTHDFNQKVSELFDNPQILDGMKNNIMNYKVKNASKTIVKTFNKTIS
jgi:processive 1,2-diacylglycerol beta-glucosyltransferase